MNQHFPEPLSVFLLVNAMGDIWYHSFFWNASRPSSTKAPSEKEFSPVENTLSNYCLDPPKESTEVAQFWKGRREGTNCMQWVWARFSVEWDWLPNGLLTVNVFRENLPNPPALTYL